MTYTVKIKETLLDELRVEAVNPLAAVEKAVKAYLEGALMLTSEKYIDVRFSVEEEKEC